MEIKELPCRSSSGVAQSPRHRGTAVQFENDQWLRSGFRVGFI
jgi:hypothetical protein